MKSHELIEHIKAIKQDTLIGDIVHSDYQLAAFVGNSCNSCIEQIDQIGVALGFDADIPGQVRPCAEDMQSLDSLFRQRLDKAHFMYTKPVEAIDSRMQKERIVSGIEDHFPKFREVAWFKLKYDIITMAELDMIRTQVESSQTDFNDLSTQLAAEDIRDTMLESTLWAVNGDFGNPTDAIKENLSVRLNNLYECPIHPSVEKWMIHELSQIAKEFNITDSATDLHILAQLSSHRPLEDAERISLELVRGDLYRKIYTDVLAHDRQLAEAYERRESIAVDACLAYYMGCHTSQKPVFLSDPCTASYLLAIKDFTNDDILAASKRLFPFGPKDDQMKYAMSENQRMDHHYRVYAEYAAYRQQDAQIEYGLNHGDITPLQTFLESKMKSARISEHIVRKVSGKIEQALKLIKPRDNGR